MDIFWTSYNFGKSWSTKWTNKRIISVFSFIYLFQLDSLRELPSECEMRDGDVIQDDAELLRPLGQLLVNPGRDDLPVGDEFSGVELGNDGLQDLVGDGGEDTVVVVDAQSRVDACERQKRKETG